MASTFIKLPVIGTTSGVSSVTATAPLSSSGGTTPNISAATASATQNGILSSTDWSTFNSKVGTAGFTSKILYVSQDSGNDTNIGTIYSPFKTIQAAINAANSVAAYYNQIVINVSPSSTGNGYNENLTFSQQGITLQSFSENYRSESVIIKGSITVNLTGTSGGTNFIAASNSVYIKGFVITATTGNTVTFSGTAFQRLWLDDVYIDNTGTGSALVMTNTGVTGATKSTITCRNSDINNSSASSPTVLVSAGRLFIAGMAYDIQNSNAAGLAISMDGASATGAVINASQCTVTGGISVTDNLAFLTLSLATISSGSSPCVVTPATPSTGYLTLSEVGFITTATNSITGAGVVVLAGNLFKLSSGGDIISTVTQLTVGEFPSGPLLLGAGATQVANAILTTKNGHFKSQQSIAPTIAVANSGTGGTASLSNATDTAGKITYTTGTGALTTSATCTITFNKTHSSAPIVVLTPNNANSGPNAVQIYVTSTTSTFVLNFAVAPLASTSYTWFYHVIETQ